MDKDAAIDETAQAVKSVGSVVGDEIGKFIKSLLNQTTGNSSSDSYSGPGGGATGTDDLATLQKKDEEFSKREEAQLQAKIQAMYASYAAKSKQEAARLEQKHEEEEEEVSKLEKLNATRVRQNFVNRAIEQTKAENKNFGAE